MAQACGRAGGDGGGRRISGADERHIAKSDGRSSFYAGGKLGVAALKNFGRHLLGSVAGEHHGDGDGRALAVAARRPETRSTCFTRILTVKSTT